MYFALLINQGSELLRRNGMDTSDDIINARKYLYSNFF